LEEVGSPAVLHDLGVLLDGIDAELDEFLGVRKEDGGGSLLVVAAVAGVEDLDAQLTFLVGLAGGDGKAA
jgi:hypothetical protein